MGCENSKEDLEARMLMLKMKRHAIRQQRIKKVKRLEELTGEKITVEPLPDYEENDDNNASNKEVNRIVQKEKIFNKKNDFDFGDDDEND